MDSEIASGAEAVVYSSEYMGLDAIRKLRPAKAYRHPELDQKLRTSRTRNEVRVIRDARNAGVRTPVIYDIDLKECSIVMEHVLGEKVKDVLDKTPESATDVCKKIGKAIAELHKNKICHGDLTTSNMILTPEGELCLLDFSLGDTLVEIEEMGVDLHLLERGLSSSHSVLSNAYAEIIEEYCKHMPNYKMVLKRVEDIKGRGRYT